MGDITKSNTKIIIFPTILLAINTTAINDVYDLIQRIETKQGSDSDEETDED